MPTFVTEEIVMPNPFRVGLIGLDTSHVSIFTKMLNDPHDPYYLAGGRVTVGFPGGSDDFELSRSRVEKFTSELRDTLGVKIVDSMEAVAESSDVIFIESVDGRVHRRQFDVVLPFGKPIFVDKPMTVSFTDAKYMFDKARSAGIALMSASSLRYWDVAMEAIGDRKGIVGCDIFGPMAEEPTQPGIFWYGVHTVEMLVTTMGMGCVEVRAFRNDDNDSITFIWADGRVASLRGLRNAHSKFGLTVHRADGPRFADPAHSKKPYYAGLLEAIMRSLPQGRSDVPAEETLEIIRIIEAANESRRTGQSVHLTR
jgi:predicted dehydrogenase